MDAEERLIHMTGIEGAVPSDDDRGESDEAVQQGDEFGHPRHLDDPRPPEADRAADENGDDQQRESDRGLRLPPQLLDGEPDRRGDRDDHAADAKEHTAAGGLVLAEPVQAQDEQQRGDEVGRGGHGCGDRRAHRSVPFENIASILRVTAKPPKMLMLASRTAIAARIWTTSTPDANWSIAPTTMMPEMAFVTLMRGV